jgi:hypothetical protein
MERMGKIITFLLEVEEDEKHLKNAAVQAMESSPEAAATNSCAQEKKKSACRDVEKKGQKASKSKYTNAFEKVCQMLQYA